MPKKYLFWLLLIFAVALVFACQKQEPKSDVSPQKIVPATYTEIAETVNGKLEITGLGEDRMHVLYVWGTPYEMGKAHGTLLRQELSSQIPQLLRLMTENMGNSVEALDEIYQQTKPYIPDFFMEEMQGIADGSGLPLQDVIRTNLIGTASEFHCSLFGAWGQSTAAKGHVVQLRALDFETEANIQHFPLLTIYQPNAGHSFANIGWVGHIGVISGISSQQIAVSEIGDDYDQENDSFDGKPFPIILREILQFDPALNQAIARMQNTSRISSLMYAIGDGKLGQVRALQTSRTLFNVYDATNLEPLTDTHPRIDDIVYWGMSWNVPKYDQRLHAQLKKHFGNINGEITVTEILPTVETGSLQAVVYDLTDMKIWVANAKADDETGPLEAYNRPFIEIDMQALFAKAKDLSTHKLL